MFNSRFASPLLLVSCLLPPTLQAQGAILPWGSNGYGQVSESPGGRDFIAVAGGTWHSVALRADGSIAVWGISSFERGPRGGRIDYGQTANVPYSKDHTLVAAGSGHSLALRKGGFIESWGKELFGLAQDVPAGPGFKQLAAGECHSLALREDGSIVAWGIHDGSDEDHGQVTEAPSGAGFIQVAAGGYSSLALRSDGSIVSWGIDHAGLVSDTPVESGFVQVAGGGFHSLALRADGSIVAWGFDNHGQVSDTPTATGFTQVAVGAAHSLALRADGSVVSWGWADPNPLRQTPNGVGYTRVAAGGYHSLVLKQGTADETETWELGSSFDITTDLNGDHRPDLLVLDDFVYDRDLPVRVLAISGSDGSVIWGVAQDVLGAELIRNVRAWRDDDLDGVADVLVTHLARTGSSGGPRFLSILSGSTGELLGSPDLPELWSGPIVLGRGEDGAGARKSLSRGYLLESLKNAGLEGELRSHDASEWHAEPELYEWDRLRVWSFDSEAARVEAQIDAPVGTRFSSRASLASSLSDLEPGHTLCLTKKPQEEWQRATLLRRAKDEQGHSGWVWCEPLAYRVKLRYSVHEVLAVGDVNDDGVPDLAVALRGVLPPGDANRVVVICGASGQALLEFVERTEKDKEGAAGYGATLALLGDLNGDGGVEFVVSSIDASFWSGNLYVCDPVSGKTRGRVEGGFDMNRMGTVLKAGADFDGDGVPDFAGSEDPFNNGKNRFPRVHLYSGATFELIRSLP